MDVIPPQGGARVSRPEGRDPVAPYSRREDLEARLFELKQDLIEREHALDRLTKSSKRSLQALVKEIANRQSEIANLQSQIQDLNSQVQHWKATFDGVVTSKSWRFTAPARFVAKLLKDVTGLLRRTEANRERVADTSVSLPPEISDQSQLPTDRNVERRVDSTTDERVLFLETAVRDFLATPKDTSGDGRYVHYVPHNIDIRFLEVKAIAFYKPQSSVPPKSFDGSGVLNNWTAISGAVPRYLGQYQPHIPDHLGYYDLRVPDVLRQQVELARRYGVYGFCFQYAQLSDVKSLDLPLKQLLSDSNLEIPFCISCDCGASQEDPALLELLARIFSDRRYVRVDDKPLLVLSGILNAADVEAWRNRAPDINLPGFYIVAAVRSASSESIAMKVDAFIEDATGRAGVDAKTEFPLIDPHFGGEIYRYSDVMEKYSSTVHSSSVVLKNVVTAWDTEPIYPGNGCSFAEASPALYARWLDRCCRHTMSQRPPERFLFISSWNDWMAGAHLEPDHRFGYAYLHATANVLRSYYRDEATELLVRDINSGFSPTSDVAIIFHCFHEDLIESVFDEYLTKVIGADLFVTVRPDISREAVERIRRRFSNVFIEPYQNRGRDIRPFLFALRRIQSLNYRFGCKVHTKKTPHAGHENGDLWRNRLMKMLLGAPDSTAQAVKRFDAESDLGLLVPAGSMLNLAEVRHHIDNTFWLDRLLGALDKTDLIGNYKLSFAAGSMFWFRVNALAGLDSLILPEDAFEHEMGQRDGTLAHALERLTALYALQKGYRTAEMDVTTSK
jgi:hypothetical protein